MGDVRRMADEISTRHDRLNIIFDLAAVLSGTGVTANALHPATLMDTKMVTEAGLQARSSVEQGADAIISCRRRDQTDARLYVPVSSPSARM